MLGSVLCITTNKHLVHAVVVLLHARFSIVGPIPFLLAAIFFSGHPYIGSTTVLPDTWTLARSCRHRPAHLQRLSHIIHYNYIMKANLHGLTLCTP